VRVQGRAALRSDEADDAKLRKRNYVMVLLGRAGVYGTMWPLREFDASDDAFFAFKHNGEPCRRRWYPCGLGAGGVMRGTP